MSTLVSIQTLHQPDKINSTDNHPAIHSMKPHLIDPLAGITHECYALINKPSLTRKRFPEGVVTIVGSEEEARAGANPAEHIVPAIVIGPSRSSEGFNLFYLIRWLNDD
jgi:hypothetical protein